MTIKEQINQDLKTAMIAGDKELVNTLRGLKSTLQYAEVAKGGRGAELDEKEVVSTLQKEAKKRQESADLYRKGGNDERAELELKEKEIIEQYLPKQLSDDELDGLVREAAQEKDNLHIGQLIALVKEKSQGAASGGRIAQAVKRFLE